MADVPAKRRFRFSLLTLLCFVLLLASAGTLWWNWEAWVPAYTLNAEEIKYSGFLPGGKYAYLRTANAIKLFDAVSGQPAHTLQVGESAEFSFSPDGKYVSTWRLPGQGWWGSGGPRFDPGVWTAEDGRWIAFNDFSGAELTHLNFSPRSSYATFNANDRRVMIRISDMRAMEPPNSDNFSFSPDEKWLAVGSAPADRMPQSRVGVYSLPDFKRMLWEKHNNRGLTYAFSPSGNLFALSLEDSTRIYDTATWTASPSFSGSAYAINDDAKALIYWNSAWWLKHPDEKHFPSAQLGTSIAHIELLDHSVLTWQPLVSHDTASGKINFDRGTLTGNLDLTAGRQFLVRALEADGGFELIDTADGKVKGTIKPWRWRHMLPAPVKDVPMLKFNDRGTQFMTQPTPTSAVVWNWEKRNMPWDMLKRAESWLTLLAAAGFAWSLRRRSAIKRLD